MKIIISESQLSLIKEALGVPNYILDAAEMLYDVVEKDIKSIDSIEDEYEFDGDIEFELGDKHKVMIDSYELKVKIEEIEDQEGVLDILAGAGLSESDLQCAFDKPLGDAERIAWGEKPATRLAMNCSGKHAGMLATCVINGWDIKTYLNADHPLQVAVLTEIEGLVGAKVSNKTFDGCGAPLFAVTTRELANAIRNITISKDPVHVEVMSAARAFPEMVAGDGRLTTRTMQSVVGLFMKEGAEGVEVATLADGRTIVFKISDGSIRPFETLMVAALAEFGINVEDKTERIYGGSEAIGSMRACITRG